MRRRDFLPAAAVAALGSKSLVKGQEEERGPHLPDTLVAREVARGKLLRDAPVASTEPMRFAYVVPKDYPVPYDTAAAFIEVQHWVVLCQQWFMREVGLTFRSEVVRVDSDQTIYDLATGALDGCDKAAIPEGEGAMIGLVMNTVEKSTGWQFLPAGTSARIGMVCTGAGGWAGARYVGNKQADYGHFLLGDWGLYKAVTGNPAPCNPWPDLHPESAFGHELLHACDVDADSDYGYFLGDTLPTRLRSQLKSHNRAFLIQNG